MENTTPKHTPGEWMIDYAKTGVVVSIFPVENGEVGKAIANVYARDPVYIHGRKSDVVDNPEGMANAVLISAAPDMLKALEYVGCCGGVTCCEETPCHVCAAIAKAKGEKP